MRWIALCVGLALFAGCEGKTGPMGPEGPRGTAGPDVVTHVFTGTLPAIAWDEDWLINTGYDLDNALITVHVRENTSEAWAVSEWAFSGSQVYIRKGNPAAAGWLYRVVIGL